MGHYAAECELKRADLQDSSPAVDQNGGASNQSTDASGKARRAKGTPPYRSLKRYGDGSEPLALALARDEDGQDDGVHTKKRTGGRKKAENAPVRWCALRNVIDKSKRRCWCRTSLPAWGVKTEQWSTKVEPLTRGRDARRRLLGTWCMTAAWWSRLGKTCKSTSARGTALAGDYRLGMAEQRRRTQARCAVAAGAACTSWMRGKTEDGAPEVTTETTTIVVDSDETMVGNGEDGELADRIGGTVEFEATDPAVMTTNAAVDPLSAKGNAAHGDDEGVAVNMESVIMPVLVEKEQRTVMAVHGSAAARKIVDEVSSAGDGRNETPPPGMEQVVSTEMQLRDDKQAKVMQAKAKPRGPGNVAEEAARWARKAAKQRERSLRRKTTVREDTSRLDGGFSEALVRVMGVWRFGFKTQYGQAMSVDALVVGHDTEDFLVGEDWMCDNGVKIGFVSSEMKWYDDGVKKILPFVEVGT
ncbi:RNA-dependent DNA polymerase [Phytophthora cinnamomi]|uniref:RNA-dependent DNA polymerase n=1 Tax=Phytophthora cinnamomi TaxID=4785 RepID=UPI00355A1AAA|nr:RNA-dependent DNA polymerase [Phytophthora cinnamomi]